MHLYLIFFFLNIINCDLIRKRIKKNNEIFIKRHVKKYRRKKQMLFKSDKCQCILSKNIDVPISIIPTFKRTGGFFYKMFKSCLIFTHDPQSVHMNFCV